MKKNTLKNEFWKHFLKFYECSKSYFITINKIICALYMNDKCFWKKKTNLL